MPNISYVDTDLQEQLLLQDALSFCSDTTHSISLPNLHGQTPVLNKVQTNNSRRETVSVVKPKLTYTYKQTLHGTRSIANKSFVQKTFCYVQDAKGKKQFPVLNLGFVSTVVVSEGVRLYKPLIHNPSSSCYKKPSYQYLFSFYPSRLLIKHKPKKSIPILHDRQLVKYCVTQKKEMLFPGDQAAVANHALTNPNQNGTGDSIQLISFTCPKNRYCELSLTFTNRIVLNVSGLPDGMIYEKQALKGSPHNSGKYLLAIELDNQTTLDAILTVPEVPRIL